VEEIRGSAGEAEAKGQIKVDWSAADVSYSNFVLVGTSPEEIVFTFGIRTAEDQNVKIADKVILSPKNAKRFFAALSQALRAYEEKFGTIDASFPTPREKAQG